MEIFGMKHIINLSITYYNEDFISDSKPELTEVNLLTYMGIFKKTFKYSVYDRSNIESYSLEKKALKLLNNNYICECSNHRNHFPKIIQYNDKENILLLTINGLSLEGYDKFLKFVSKYSFIPKLEGIEKQIDCINNNLKRNKIIHLDILPKNVCIDTDGTISLIDFDLCVINDKPEGIQITNRYNHYIKYNISVKSEILKSLKSLE